MFGISGWVIWRLDVFEVVLYELLRGDLWFVMRDEDLIGWKGILLKLVVKLLLGEGVLL